MQPRVLCVMGQNVLHDAALWIIVELVALRPLENADEP